VQQCLAICTAKGLKQAFVSLDNRREIFLGKSSPFVVMNPGVDGPSFAFRFFDSCAELLLHLNDLGFFFLIFP
jgi:hypothetical protein